MMEAKVTGYALAPPTNPSLFDMARAADGLTSIIADVRDRNALIRAVKEANPDIVIHMAAQPLVRASYEDPVETYEVNVLGTVNLLEAVRHAKNVRAVMIVTSDKCYANHEHNVPYREDDPMGGRDPYSSSKGCAELVSFAYFSSFFQGVAGRPALATARAGNVIGGGDWARDRLLTDMVAAFSRGAPAIIRYPDAVRPWQHVLEPLSGYLILAERLVSDGHSFAGAWNFGPNLLDCRTVSAVADLLCNLWGNGASWAPDQAAHPHEAGLLMLDHTKAMDGLGWTPAWNLETALESVVVWHRRLSDGDSAAEICREQINSYLRDLDLRRQEK